MIHARAETPTHCTPTMRTFLATTLLCLTLGYGFWFSLTRALDDMTRRDCELGSVRACVQLKQAGAL